MYGQQNGCQAVSYCDSVDACQTLSPVSGQDNRLIAVDCVNDQCSLIGLPQPPSALNQDTGLLPPPPPGAQVTPPPDINAPGPAGVATGGGAPVATAPGAPAATPGVAPGPGAAVPDMAAAPDAVPVMSDMSGGAYGGSNAPSSGPPVNMNGGADEVAPGGSYGF